MTYPHHELVQELKRVYQQMDAQSVDLLDRIYSTSIQFEDPFRQISGIDSLKNYFREMYSNVENAHFVFTQEYAVDDCVFLEWELSFKHRWLNGGKLISLPGITRLTIESKIIWHRDYFDSSQMLFEHMPLLRYPVRWLKQRL